MQSKDELVQAIRDFVRVDNEIKVIARELALRRKQKTQLSQDLVTTMRDHKIDCFEIQGGKIVYSKRSVKKPLSQKLLSTLIAQFYRDDATAAEQLQEFLRNNREEVVKESVARKTDKVISSGGGGGGASAADGVDGGVEETK